MMTLKHYATVRHVTVLPVDQLFFKPDDYAFVSA